MDDADIVGEAGMMSERRNMQDTGNPNKSVGTVENETTVKVRVLCGLLDKSSATFDDYYEAMENTHMLVMDYANYMTTAPIDCDRELLRLPSADHTLTCALMTMLLREDRFYEGAFTRRLGAGQVQPILQKMIAQISQLNE